jgi:transcription antitermination protein NusB
MSNENQQEKNQQEENQQEENQQKENKTSTYNERTTARQCLVQMLYEWSFSSDSMDHVFQSRVQGLSGVDLTYLKQVFFQLGAQIAEIDAIVSPVLDRDISQLGIIELSILRLSTYELKQVLDIPYRVVLDEAIELAREFGAQDSYKYINAVLEKVARGLRKSEMK